MSQRPLADFDVLSFDVYGTLIDWEAGMIAGLRPLTHALEREGRGLARDAVLEAHAFHESTQQLWTPAMRYRDLLAVVYKRLAEEWGVPAAHDDCVAYGRSVEHWPAFADSAEALRYLQGHYRLAVLSNVDNESVAHSLAKLGVSFDAVFTAEDVGSYKPAARNFDYMLAQLERMELARERVLHTAESMFHDHAPANRHGLASCWIHRRHDKQGFGATVHPGRMPRHDFRFESMAQMAAAHEKGM